MNIRGMIKGVLCRFITIIEYCDDCGVEQPFVWTSPDALWAEVTDKRSHLTDGGGVLCPECFDKRAKAKGLLLRWVPVVEYRGQERVESHERYMALLTSEPETR